MTDWTRAKCLQGDPDMWFPDKGEPAWPAQMVCRTLCPIQRECLDFAVSSGEEHGIWGGVAARDLHEIRKGRLEAETAMAGSNTYLRKVA